MLTAFGKELRKLRVDEGDRMIDMAEKVNCSPSFISSIERGTRTIPEDFIKRLEDAYDLKEERLQLFEDVMDISQKDMKIDLREINEDRRDVAVLLARNFNSIEEEKIKELREYFECFNEVREA